MVDTNALQKDVASFLVDVGLSRHCAPAVGPQDDSAAWCSMGSGSAEIGAVTHLLQWDFLGDWCHRSSEMSLSNFLYLD